VPVGQSQTVWEHTISHAHLLCCIICLASVVASVVITFYSTLCVYVLAFCTKFKQQNTFQWKVQRYGYFFWTLGHRPTQPLDVNVYNTVVKTCRTVHTETLIGDNWFFIQILSMWVIANCFYNEIFYSGWKHLTTVVCNIN